MQSSKNHFEAIMTFNDETITRLFKTEFYVYERMTMLVQLASAITFAALALLVPELPMVLKTLFLMLGCLLLVFRDFIPQLRAEGILQQRGGAESRVKCTFTETQISVEGGQHFKYKQIDRILEDSEYFYLFLNRQNAVMLPINGIVPNNAERFRSFVEKKTGKEWQYATPSFMTMNLKDAIQMVRDNKERIRMSKDRKGR